MTTATATAVQPLSGRALYSRLKDSYTEGRKLAFVAAVLREMENTEAEPLLRAERSKLEAKGLRRPQVEDELKKFQRSIDHQKVLGETVSAEELYDRLEATTNFPPATLAKAKRILETGSWALNKDAADPLYIPSPGETPPPHSTLPLAETGSGGVALHPTAPVVTATREPGAMSSHMPPAPAQHPTPSHAETTRKEREGKKGN